MNVIIGAVIFLVVGAAMLYIKKEKKRGVKCIGCPSAGACSQHCHGDSDL